MSSRLPPPSRKDPARRRTPPPPEVLEARVPEVITRKGPLRERHSRGTSTSFSAADFPPALLMRGSQMVGLCIINADGWITDANDLFHRLSGRKARRGSPISVSACFSEEVWETARAIHYARTPYCLSCQIAQNDGGGIPASVEIFALGDSGGQMWLILPKKDHFCHTRDISASEGDAAGKLPEHLFDCLHGGVAQSIAALAMNLHLVSQSNEVPDSPNARQLLLGSIQLVEQCSREVRSLSRLLRPGSPVSKANCA